MVMPPEADPVSADSTLVATASDTSGPPSMESTHSATATKAGNDATTAPKPTRLATLTIGSTEALAPASSVSRNVPSRVRFSTTSTTIAAISAVITDHKPLTPARDTPPHCGKARKLVSIRGRITNDMSRFTITSTASGNIATATLGSCGLCEPCLTSAGSKASEVVARSRTIGSSIAASILTFNVPKPSPRALASFCARSSHHMPKPNMTAEAMMPRPGAAKGVVPKKGIGMAFCTAGVPGMADMVKVAEPNITAAGARRLGMSAVRNSPCAIGTMTKKATNRLTPP